jgi:general secretion pathway protein D
MRFEAAASIVHTGQKLREDGKLDEAVAEFQKALAIDPSLFIAKQELKRTLKMINDQRNPPPQAAGPPEGLRARFTRRRAPSNSPHLERPHHGQDHRQIRHCDYRTIGQLAGINVLFDPDYTSPRHQG